MSQQCSKFLKACDDYLQFVQDHSSQEQLIHEIQRTQEQVIKLLGEIKCAIDAVNNEQQIASSINKNNWYIDFAMLLELLKQNEQLRGNYFHISEIKKTAEALQVNEIHTIIPILIRTKDVNPNNSWIDILKKFLGLASVWNEIELWQALEALSYREEINNVSTADTGVFTLRRTQQSFLSKFIINAFIMFGKSGILHSVQSAFINTLLHVYVVLPSIIWVTIN